MAKREQKVNFEEGLAQLEQLVSQLEAGKLPLSESFGAYEAGIELLKKLEAELSEHEAKIRLLTADGEQTLNMEGEDHE